MVRMGKDGSLLLLLVEAGACTLVQAMEYMKVNNGSPAMPPSSPPRPSQLTPSPPSSSSSPSFTPSPIDYASLHSEIDTLTKDEDDLYANTANVASAIYHAIMDARGDKGCNWAGFYFSRKCINTTDESILLLGPFMGKPACRRIQFSEGACGAAARTMEIQLVPDVHKFPGHISCDSASNSEVRLPPVPPPPPCTLIRPQEREPFHGFATPTPVEPSCGYKIILQRQKLA